jgi:DNA polymerase III alpha subunit
LTAIKGVGSSAVEEIMRNRPFTNFDQMLFTEDGKWKPSKMNKTCFDSLCKVEAFGSLDEVTSGAVRNHHQIHEIIVGNYDLLKKGRHGMTKTAAKKLMNSQGFVPDFIKEKIIENYDLEDWPRPVKIGNSVDLMAGADEDLVFPPRIMEKINRSQVPAITSLSGKDKGIVWFCIQEIQEKKTKNGKVFYRMRVCDNNSESTWLRVWTKFDKTPEVYTIWLSEVASTENWGCSTSSYKMRQLSV